MWLYLPCVLKLEDDDEGDDVGVVKVARVSFFQKLKAKKRC